MSTAVSAKIRMFRLNELGDCFLVTFTAGGSTSHLLIDCGSFRNSGPSIARLDAITQAIGEALNGQPIDVVVGTHQHNDHVSGFVHCEDAFRAIGVRQVWLSWLDDPGDEQARAIGEAHGNLRLHLSAARDVLRAARRRGATVSAATAHSLEVLDDMLGFFGAPAAGAPPDVPARGIKILKEIGAASPEYLQPGRTLEMPGLPENVVRVHVLGPPRKDDLLFRANPRKGESYDPSLAAHLLQATKFLDAAKARRHAASSEEAEYPFKQEFKIGGTKGGSVALRRMRQRYNQRPDAWRTIDDDWMQQAETLALYLDTFTNNSSLALAIELVESGKVLLFAADAQTGNWVSWRDVAWQRAGVTTDSLLARAVFYKVGHHASHNATLVDAFERMTHPDLAALIPVHKRDPNITKKNGWKMPARNLFKRLKEKTSNRVLQMDGDNPPECDPRVNPAKAAWKKIGVRPVVTATSIEVEIEG
jgi:beta-lactamase superfamily II metal-dependent hydrolase